MEKLLLRTNSAIQDCEQHLLATDSAGTEIESYLTQYLLIVLCAEVQQEIYKLAEARASSANDSNLATYVATSSQKILRSVSKKDIAAFVGMFGSDCKNKLNEQIDDSEVTLYNNAVANRHDIAHRRGSSFSFLDLKDAVTSAERILVATAAALV